MRITDRQVKKKHNAKILASLQVGRWKAAAVRWCWNHCSLLSSLARLHLDHRVCTRWLKSFTVLPLKWHTLNPRPHRHQQQHWCHPSFCRHLKLHPLWSEGVSVEESSVLHEPEAGLASLVELPISQWEKLDWEFSKSICTATVKPCTCHTARLPLWLTVYVTVNY